MRSGPNHVIHIAANHITVRGAGLVSSVVGTVEFRSGQIRSGVVRRFQVR